VPSSFGSPKTLLGGLAGLGAACDGTLCRGGRVRCGAAEGDAVVGGALGAGAATDLDCGLGSAGCGVLRGLGGLVDLDGQSAR
jgi:hypothetical protein